MTMSFDLRYGSSLGRITGGVKLLAIETATRAQSVAILDGERVLGCSDQATDGSHARWLVPTIDHLLTSKGLTLSDLDGLGVSIGPGSFTGLRVGLATVLGFRTVTGLPLASVPTLEGMAWNLRGSPHTLCPILKGRSGEAYWAVYRWSPGGSLEQVVPAQVGSVKEIVESVQGPMLMYGDGWEAYRSELSRYLGPKVHHVRGGPKHAMAPSAVSIGLAALARLARGEDVGAGIAPLYIQRAEAEVNRERVVPSGRKREGPGGRGTSGCA